MDRKSIIVLVVCFAALVLWQPLVVNKLYPPKKGLPTTNQVATATATNSATLAPQASATNQPAAAVTPAPVLTLATNAPEQSLDLETPDAHYTFTSYGGGLKAVELLHYKEVVPRRRGEEASKRWATLNEHATVPAMAVLGLDAHRGEGVYKLSRSGNTVQADAVIPNGLAVSKRYTATNNYLVNVTVRLENTSDKEIVLPEQEWEAGTAMPMSSHDDGTAVGVMWSDRDNARDISASWFNNATLGCIPGTPRTEYTAGESNVFWVAPHNQFFAIAVMAKEPAQRVVVRRYDLPAPSAEETRTDTRLNKKPYAYQSAMVYGPLKIAPGKAVEKNFTLFAGPKEYRTLAAIAGGANNNVDAVMGFNGFFGFFSKGLLLGMNWLHEALKLSYGWAIIAITFIIKLLFWPLTRASTRSMKRMAALQPQMKAIQEKYKEDPVKMNRKTMEFMKEHKVSPLGGCLPMLLQMPVFIGFFYMIRSAIELRGAPFLWVADLSRPDTLFIIPGIFFPFNLLPLIMGATMLWQAHLTPPSPGVDPMQAKIMKYMPLMFMVFLYNYSAALTLYWTVQNLLTITQTKLTKDSPPAAPGPPAPVHPPQRKRA